MEIKYKILKEYFGHSDFREGQGDIVDCLLSGRDALGIMPTGAGKSICYQVPALVFEGITVVVSPLISLMKDQVTALVQSGISAAYINSSLSESQYIRVFQNAEKGKYIKFEVKRSRIEQGNAVIAVKDGSGNIMWSWHIWVTNKNVYSTIPINTVALIYTTPNTSQKTYNFMPVPLGWDDDDPNHPNCPYYQWGRKDPFCPSDGTTDNKDKTMYDISGNNVYLKIEQGPVTTSTAIRNPIIYYYNGDHSTNYDWNSTTYFDYWNATNGNTISVNDNEVVKTVYDPNPVGFKMPSPDAFSGFTQDGYNQYDKSKWNVKDTSMPNNGFEFYTQGWKNDPTSYWHANGFRALNDGLLRNVGSWGIYWSSGPYDQTSGRYLYFTSSDVFPQSYSMDRATGFSVRPVSE